jgi:hypothetical protein
MPEETHNPSEERLQRYAKERRAQGGDFALHPATRRMLQGEVARTFGAKEAPAKSRGWLAWLNSWSGRLAVGATAAVVIAGSWVIWNNRLDQHAMQLARAEMPMSKSKLAELAESSGRVTTDKDMLVASAPASPAVAAEADRKNTSAAQPVTLLAAKPLEDETKKVAADKATAMDALAQNSSVVRYQNQGEVINTFRNESALSLAPAAQYTYAINSPADAQKQDGANQLNFAGNSVALNQNNAPAGQSANSSVLLQNQMQLSRNAAPSQGGVATYAANEPKSLAENVALYKEQATPQIAARNDAFNTAESRTLRSGSTLRATTPAPAVTTTPSKEAQNSAVVVASGALAAVTTTPVPTSRFYRVQSDSRGGVSRNRALVESTQAESALAETSPVLNDFVIEQSGNTVRVIDGDGSVYAGTVEAADSSADRARRSALVIEKLENAPAGQELSFRAVGSNVTLRQTVTVNARFGLETNAMRAAGYGGAPAEAPNKLRDFANSRTAFGAERGFAGQYGAATNAATIEGTVRIGTTNQTFRAYRRGP